MEKTLVICSPAPERLKLEKIGSDHRTMSVVSVRHKTFIIGIAITMRLSDATSQERS